TPPNLAFASRLKRQCLRALRPMHALVYDVLTLAPDRLSLKLTKALQSGVLFARLHSARPAKQNQRTSAPHSLPHPQVRHDLPNPSPERVLHRSAPHPTTTRVYRVRAIAAAKMSCPIQRRARAAFQDNRFSFVLRPQRNHRPT